MTRPSLRTPCRLLTCSAVPRLAYPDGKCATHTRYPDAGTPWPTESAPGERRRPAARAADWGDSLGYTRTAPIRAITDRLEPYLPVPGRPTEFYGLSAHDASILLENLPAEAAAVQVREGNVETPTFGELVDLVTDHPNLYLNGRRYGPDGPGERIVATGVRGHAGTPAEFDALVADLVDFVQSGGAKGRPDTATIDPDRLYVELLWD